MGDDDELELHSSPPLWRDFLAADYVAHRDVTYPVSTLLALNFCMGAVSNNETC